MPLTPNKGPGASRVFSINIGHSQNNLSFSGIPHVVLTFWEKIRYLNGVCNSKGAGREKKNTFQLKFSTLKKYLHSTGRDICYLPYGPGYTGVKNNNLDSLIGIGRYIMKSIPLYTQCGGWHLLYRFPLPRGMWDVWGHGCHKLLVSSATEFNMCSIGDPGSDGEGDNGADSALPGC